MRRAAPCLPITLMNWSMIPHGMPGEVKYHRIIGYGKIIYTSMAMLCCLASKSFVLLRCGLVCSQLLKKCIGSHLYRGRTRDSSTQRDRANYYSIEGWKGLGSMKVMDNPLTEYVVSTHLIRDIP